MKVMYEDVKQMAADEQKHAIDTFTKETQNSNIAYRADGGCIATYQWGWKIKAGKK